MPIPNSTNTVKSYLYFEEAYKGALIAYYFRWMLYSIVLLLTGFIYSKQGLTVEVTGNLIIIGFVSIYNLAIGQLLRRKKIFTFVKFFTVTVDLAFITIHVYRVSVFSTPIAVSTTATIFIYFILILLSVFTFDKKLTIYATILAVAGFNLNYYVQYLHIEPNLMAKVISTDIAGHTFKSVYMLIFGLLLLYLPDLITRLLYRQEQITADKQKAELNLKLEKQAQEFIQQKLDYEHETNEILKEANEELHQQSEELRVQRDEIEKQRQYLHEAYEIIKTKNAAVLASINYANRIQQVTLPGLPQIAGVLESEFFVFHKPKDIISGDFYWFNSINIEDSDSFSTKKLRVAIIADCTGHGVPGAFMTLIGINFLNEIILASNIYKPNLILQILNQKIQTFLNQNDSSHEANDGMDLGILIIDKENKTIEFAGAKMDLVRISNNKLIEYKGSKNSIGGFSPKNKEKIFESIEIQYNNYDCFYLFTDGYKDQIGGKFRRKFMIANFKELLSDMHNKPMTEQKACLETTLTNWLINEQTEKPIEQVDDILVFGMKL